MFLDEKIFDFELDIGTFMTYFMYFSSPVQVKSRIILLFYDFSDIL